MIGLKTGDILSDDSEALVNPVNCNGIMGKGLALRFKHKFPDNFAAYRDACRKGIIRPRQVFAFKLLQLFHPHYIINFPTKPNWWDKSRIEDIKYGLEALADEIKRLAIGSIAVPPLGCGLGGLNWADVKPLIEDTLCVIGNLQVTIFEPLDGIDRNGLGNRPIAQHRQERPS